MDREEVKAAVAADNSLDVKLQGLLKELTQVVNHATHPNTDRLLERVKGLRANVTEIIEMRKKKFTTPLEARRKILHGRMRRAVTGSSDRSVRAFVQEKRRQPSVAMFLDKCSFLLGVLLITGTEYVLLVQPHSFCILYSAVLPLLLTGRVFYYKSKKWVYFLYDFCYLVQVMCFLYIFAVPQSVLLLKLLFLYSNGPLAWAIPIWRNSLVFHDFEKLTSVFIHMYPPWLLFTLRWYPLNEKIANADLTSVSMREFAIATAVYALWQAGYYLKTEWIDKEKLDADPELETSLRYLTQSKRSAVNVFALRLCRKMKLFAKDEEFHHDSTKTKAVFIGFQAVFVVVTMLMSIVLLWSMTLNLLFIFAIFAMAVWNGADYMFEVFSRRYIAGLESRAVPGASQSLSPQRWIDNKEGEPLTRAVSGGGRIERLASSEVIAGAIAPPERSAADVSYVNGNGVTGDITDAVQLAQMMAEDFDDCISDCDRDDVGGGSGVIQEGNGFIDSVCRGELFETVDGDDGEMSHEEKGSADWMTPVVALADKKTL